MAICVLALPLIGCGGAGASADTPPSSATTSSGQYGFAADPTAQGPEPHDRVWSVGTNFYLNPQVVLKADWQHFDVNRNLTRFDLGLGLNF